MQDLGFQGVRSCSNDSVIVVSVQKAQDFKI